MSEIVELKTGYDGSHGNGAGTGSGGRDMELRLARLEDDMKDVKADMKVVRSDLAELKGKVSMLPGYPGIAFVVSLIGALIVIAIKFLPNPPPLP